MKSAKHKPVESDEPGPWKHAPRAKFDTLSRWEMYGVIHRAWSWPSGYSWQCLDCSHEINKHYRGWCDECRHECDGADTLHDALIPIKADVRRLFEKHAKLRQSK